MPSYSNSGFAEAIFEGHEDRIQRLESDQQKLVSQSTESLTKIEYLTRQVETSHQALAETLQTSFKDLGEKVVGAATQIEVVAKRVESLEQEGLVSVRRWTFIKKLSIPFIIAAASVIATKFGEQAWAWLTR